MQHAVEVGPFHLVFLAALLDVLRFGMFTLIAAIVAVGVIIWAINYAVPMEPVFKRAVTAVAIVCLVLYALKVFGLFDGHVRFPH